jgi:large subunit ribosomal protein L17
MRHRVAHRQLSRNSSHREAMFRNMVTSLMVHGRIQTTEAKAKELRRYAEKVITLGRKLPPSALASLGEADRLKANAKRIHLIRQARHWVRDEEALHRVFTEYAERYKTRPGGYTRILKLGFRPGDNAAMALIELVDHPAKVVAPVVDAEAPASDEKKTTETVEAAPAEESKPKRARKKKSEPAE